MSFKSVSSTERRWWSETPDKSEALNKSVQTQHFKTEGIQNFNYLARLGLPKYI